MARPPFGTLLIIRQTGARARSAPPSVDGDGQCTRGPDKYPIRRHEFAPLMLGSPGRRVRNPDTGVASWPTARQSPRPRLRPWDTALLSSARRRLDVPIRAWCQLTSVYRPFGLDRPRAQRRKAASYRLASTTKCATAFVLRGRFTSSSFATLLGDAGDRFRRPSSIAQLSRSNQ